MTCLSKYFETRLRFFNELLVKINVATSECRKNLELAVIGIKQVSVQCAIIQYSAVHAPNGV